MNEFLLRSIDPTELSESFSEIPEPPKKLFLCGEIPPVKNIPIAFVGSRKYSAYGKKACESLIAGLAGYPITIISGLALGIDAIAHQKALEVGLTTVAFPGSGLSKKVLYPASHLSLAESIITSGGALVSEYEENFKATPWSFPQRNRLMAAYARMVVIIEATKKSGTLITARLGTEYNKIVGAVPGEIFKDESAGANWLIQLGATPILSVSDILKEIGFSEIHKNKDQPLPLLSETEQKIIDALTVPKTKQEIIEELSLDPIEASILFSTLEIKELIRESVGYLERIA